MNSLHILYIEDDPDDQEIFSLALQQVSKNINYTTTNDALNALQMLQEPDRKIDHIFLDLHMPYMSGFEFLAEFARQGDHKKIPLTVISAQDHPSTLALMQRLGFSDFIGKPDTIKKLESSLRSSLKAHLLS